MEIVVRLDRFSFIYCLVSIFCVKIQKVYRTLLGYD